MIEEGFRVQVLILKNRRWMNMATDQICHEFYPIQCCWSSECGVMQLEWPAWHSFLTNFFLFFLIWVAQTPFPMGWETGTANKLTKRSDVLRSHQVSSRIRIYGSLFYKIFMKHLNLKIWEAIIMPRSPWTLWLFFY